MWLFTKYGMLSTVSKSKGIVHVRARSRKHLAACLVRGFGELGARKYPLQESPRECLDAGTLDYRWRVKLHQREWHVLVAALSADVMDYSNFKDAAHTETGGVYSASLTRIWLEMRELQEREVLSEDRMRRAAKTAAFMQHYGTKHAKTLSQGVVGEHVPCKKAKGKAGVNLRKEFLRAEKKKKGGK